jgi:Arc/MetJ family transcription regulator
MNTQLILEDKLINQAMRITGKKTPQEVVVFALQKLFIQQDNLSQAFGKYPWEGDLDTMRSDVKHVSN